MKKNNLAKSTFYIALCAIVATSSVSCKKTALTEQSIEDASQSDLVLRNVKNLFVSAADTAALTNNLWRYDFTSGTSVDSSAFATNAKDGNGVYYNSNKNELYQLSRKNKTIYVFKNPGTLTNPPLLDRSFTDSTLTSGREITYDNYRDILYIANNSDSSIRIYKNFSTLSGNVTGKAVKIQGQPWGIFYDGASNANRLIVVIDQAAMRLDIFDAPQKLSGTVTASRSLNISNRPNGTFSRLHGLNYNSTRDILFVTEIGEATAPLVITEGKPAFNADGGIYIIRNAAAKLSAGGSFAADNFIYGPSTLLGNPVDISFAPMDGFSYIFVAEKANKKILSFKLKDDGNVAPTLLVPTSYSPEALTTRD